MIIRPAAAEDVDAMLAINNAAVPHVNRLSRLMFADLLRQAVACRVATADGAVVGFILALDEHASYSSENYRWFVGNLKRFLYVDRIAVAPQHRGEGVGRTLYQEVFAEARRHALDAVTCEVNLDPPNPASLRFHIALGFEQVGVLRHLDDEKVVALLIRRTGGQHSNTWGHDGASREPVL